MKQLMDSLEMPIPSFSGRPWWNVTENMANKGKEDPHTADHQDLGLDQNCLLSKRKRWETTAHSIDCNEEPFKDPCKLTGGSPEQETSGVSCNGTEGAVELNGIFKRETLGRSCSDRKRKAVVEKTTDASMPL